MAPNHKRITKHLYSKLKHGQEDDAPVTAPTLTEIKFYLKNHRHCSQIIVEGDPDSDDVLAELPSDIPRFILSQLEAQKIADIARTSPQISAVLLVICENLAHTPTQTEAFPTVFLCNSPDQHRTYCVFAYLNHHMASRTYCVKELLELRDPENSPSLLKKLKANQEISKCSPTSPHTNQGNSKPPTPTPSTSSILRMNVVDVVKAKSSMLPTQSRRLKKTKDDVSSSTESDEILFHGKKQPRLANGDVQWKYRGRTGSEVTSNEPLSAPTGLAAQQNEGFQRFFKAVVSPTHVRVTAGGRIVPNTRGSVSPTAKWDKDRSALEEQDSTEPAKDGRLKAENGTHGQVPHPMISPIFPGHPAFFQHMGLPMPLYPVHNGVPFGYGMPPAHSVQSTAMPTSSTQSQQNADAAAKAVKAEDGAGDKKPRPAPIKISPPDQFDQSRPFYHNGNVIYPGFGPGQAHMPMLIPSPYFPQGMVGSPAFAAAPRMGTMAPQPSPSAPMLSPSFPPPHFSANPGAGAQSQTLRPPPAAKPAAKPPITSIRPSEITKRQLDALRSSLKYYEDQLQYNKHQIDEKWTQGQVQMIKHNIQQFEHNYKMQLGFEATYYPKSGTSSEAGAAVPAQQASCKTPSRPSSIKEGPRGNTSSSGSIRSNGHASSLRRFRSHDLVGSRSGKERNLSAVGINSSKGSDTSAALEALEAHIRSKMMNDQQGANDSTKRPGLPSGAAMAPPFSPGMQSPYSLQASKGTGMVGEPRGGSQAGYSNDYDPYQWHSAPLLPIDQRGDWEIMQSANSCPTNSSQPYLVGTLPRGVNPYNARGTDYVYSRELTTEEKRARQVYWGQAPSMGVGLPKFDGKDFYPPSPVKPAPTAGVPSKVKTRQLPTGQADVDYNFRLRSAENDPFSSSRDAKSIRSQESSQKFSKAIPIVAPDDVDRANAPKKVNVSSNVSQVDNGTDDVRKAFKDFNLSSPSKSSVAESSSEKKPSPVNRRGLERSSNKSSHDLWQTMLKRGSGSGTVLPSTVSSTTATGYLPPYQGNAAASLTPAISNTMVSPARASSSARDKPVDLDVPQPPVEKVGENRPSKDVPSVDAIKELRESMLRDAERRGVIGSDWH
ncbi:hypothetical protein F5B20DRAFT_525398 [Whalleya microplaca]|nr:hypothetical protein F5B20DRAFT_525398 [Whalleya microplaca]